ncbi:NUDIX hydrolase [Pontibacter sp. JH31]|uniref:GDP-mannose pyrophosphatase n=1 Tax=Pontibacter aquaedesilientis TaxID=2766980 RepID=A0ABR7XBA7_9BACT|nr:NUDIX hydrolase [Pontibacter aquaedesilientis]MBD1395584.1 NUDIX hydrolase [Pontibacter aquaedesilientis]
MEIKKREKAYNGYFKIYKLTVEQHGHTFEREQFDRGVAVAAMVYDTEQEKYILTRQFRVGPETELVEVVAGMVDEGESPETSIAREIEEEIGYSVDSLKHLHTFYSSPGGTTEKVHLYYAEVSHQHADGGGKDEEHEHIELVAYTREELLKEAFADAKTIIAQQWVQLQG